MEEVKTIIKWGWKGIAKVFKISRIIFLVFAAYISLISLFVFFSKREQAKSFIDPQLILQENRKVFYKFIHDKKLNSSQEGKAFIATYRILICGFIGEACTDNPNDGDYYFKQSIFGKAADLIAFPFANPPASGFAWITYKATDLGLAPKALAQPLGGIGLNAISPIYPIWKIFRDIAYLAIVLIMLTIGFLIMLRTKINPQTVINIENSLPKIIVSLILITLSFPLAGLLIDLMNIILLLVVFLIYPTNPVDLANKYIAGGANTLFFGSINFWTMATKIGPALLNVIPFTIKEIIQLPVTILLTMGLYKLIINPTAKATAGASKGLDLEGEVQVGPFGAGGGMDIQIPAITSTVELLAKAYLIFVIFLVNFLISHIALYVIATLALLLSLLFTLFKLFFLILFTYLRIILFIIFSPLYMLLEAIPGKSGFSDWLKSLFIELLTFPLVVFFLILPALILSIEIPNSQSIWAPPFLFGLNNEAIIYLVAGGIFLMSPDLIRQIKKSLGAQKPLIGLDFKTFLFGGGALIGGIAGGIQTTRSYISLIPGAENYLRRLGGIGKWLAGPSLGEEIAEAMKSMSTTPDELQKQQGKK